MYKSHSNFMNNTLGVNFQIMGLTHNALICIHISRSRFPINLFPHLFVIPFNLFSRATQCFIWMYFHVREDNVCRDFRPFNLEKFRNIKNFKVVVWNLFLRFFVIILKTGMRSVILQSYIFSLFWYIRNMR